MRTEVHMTNQSSDVYRRLMGRFATGVAVVTVNDEGRCFGATVNSLTSVSLDPLLLLICLRDESRLLAKILAKGKFSISVLAEHQENVSGYYARSFGSGKDIEHEFDQDFASIAGAIAGFQCQLECVYPGGDHKVVLGHVVKMLGGENPLAPLIYHEGKYAKLARGREINRY